MSSRPYGFPRSFAAPDGVGATGGPAKPAKIVPPVTATAAEDQAHATGKRAQTGDEVDYSDALQAIDVLADPTPRKNKNKLEAYHPDPAQEAREAQQMLNRWLATRIGKSWAEDSAHAKILGKRHDLAVDGKQGPRTQAVMAGMADAGKQAVAYKQDLLEVLRHDVANEPPEAAETARKFMAWIEQKAPGDLLEIRDIIETSGLLAQPPKQP